jgi:hypothetical protein
MTLSRISLTRPSTSSPTGVRVSVLPTALAPMFLNSRVSSSSVNAREVGLSNDSVSFPSGSSFGTARFSFTFRP